MENHIVLELLNVRKSFARPERGRFDVLSDVTVTIRRGEIVGIIGPSGVGKTTLLNIISGYTRPDSGSVKLADGNQLFDL